MSIDYEKQSLIDQIRALPSQKFVPYACRGLIAQTRVLLEREGQFGRYPHLHLYGNWSSHPKLERGAEFVLKKSDEVYARIMDPANGDYYKQQNILFEVFSTTALIVELRDFWQSVGVWPDFLYDHIKGSEFLRGLLYSFEQRGLERTKENMKIALRGYDATKDFPLIATRLEVSKKKDDKSGRGFDFTLGFTVPSVGGRECIKIIVPMNIGPPLPAS